MQSGVVGLKCAVCGLPPVPLNDTDERAGYISANVHFGPNLIAGIVNESSILGYSVYAVDTCNRKLGGALASVTAIQNLDCCDVDAYNVDVTAWVPDELSGLAFMIVPDTDIGPLSAGVVTNFVVDTNRTRAVGVSSLAFQPHIGPAGLPSALCTVLTAVAIVVILRW